MAEMAPMVVGMAQYLRETMAEVDDTIREIQRRRALMAVRLAGLAAAEDPAVEAAAVDYQKRASSGTPYEGAESAEALISEAYSHFVH